MSSILVELTASIVSSHAASIEMTSEELLQEIQKVYQTLKGLDSEPVQEVAADAPAAMNPKKSIQKDQVICMICGKGGFKTLSRHLKQAHDIKPGAYRKQFGLPAGTPLAAKNYSEARRQAAITNNLSENLAKGRATRLARLSAAKSAPAAKAAPKAAPKTAVKPKKKSTVTKAPKK